jgi:hypothetical protein
LLQPSGISAAVPAPFDPRSAPLPAPSASIYQCRQSSSECQNPPRSHPLGFPLCRSQPDFSQYIGSSFLREDQEMRANIRPDTRTGRSFIT